MSAVDEPFGQKQYAGFLKSCQGGTATYGRGTGGTNNAPHEAVETENVATFQCRKSRKVPKTGGTALAVAVHCGAETAYGLGKRHYGIRQPRPVCGMEML